MMISRNLGRKTRVAGFLIVAILFLLCQAAIHGAAFRQNQGCENILLASGKKVALHYQLPQQISSDTRVLFVCHGVKRNPEKYLLEWSKYGESLGVILIAPGFSKEEFPKGKNYNQGNVLLDDDRVNPPELWSFAAIEQAFTLVKEALGLNSDNYLVYGHSAGAQFVHRLLILMPQCRARVAIAANPGSLTFVSGKDPYPYGLPPGFTEAELKRALQRRLILLLGQKDTDSAHKYLNNSAMAKKQGINRFERGHNFFVRAREIAGRLKSEFNWVVEEVPGVGHSNRGMTKAAVEIFRRVLAENRQSDPGQ